MTLNAWSKKIHENAVAHGWWENERTFAEVVSLFHSELSEALEEFRAKRPMMYFPCKSTGRLCVDGRKEENLTCGSRHENCRSEKPEGIAVELVDCVIRILDFLGHENTDIDDLMKKCGQCADNCIKVQLPEAIADLHYLISYSYRSNNYKSDADERNEYLCVAVEYIRKWLELHGENMEKIMLIKHEYNRTRDYRHGGKTL